MRIIYKKNIFLHQTAKIKGVKNISINDVSEGALQVGMRHLGFLHRNEITYLNISGNLIINGKVYIARGCRFDIAGTAEIGNGTRINPYTKFMIMDKLVIGENCAVSWDCQIIDSDFHEIHYENKKEKENSVIIGNNVWIGCGVKIFKGTSIPDNCVIAAYSIVRGVFMKENCLIGGNPAKVIKENVSWNM